ncbi:hypothetical protein CIY_13800 [Butyrivibrio fibrisolvens 16/4]|nr:hypothetical protein CIY_13800 [Butyrivibrio fibrisolvens 16/4]
MENLECKTCGNTFSGPVAWDRLAETTCWGQNLSGR